MALVGLQLSMFVLLVLGRHLFDALMELAFETQPNVLFNLLSMLEIKLSVLMASKQVISRHVLKLLEESCKQEIKPDVMTGI